MSYPRTIALVTTLVTGACTASQQKPVLETVLDSRDQRQQSFEAMLRVLDEHPEYVGEFFDRARQHSRTLQRLLRVTAAHLHEKDLAEMTAAELTRAPDGLQSTLIASLDAMQSEPEAMKASAAAIEARADETARMLVQRELAVKRMMREIIQIASRDDQTATVFRAALTENATPLAAIIARDSELTVLMFKNIAKVGLERGSDEIKSLVK